MKCYKILMDKVVMKLRNRTCRCCELGFIAAVYAKNHNSSRRSSAVSGLQYTKYD